MIDWNKPVLFNGHLVNAEVDDTNMKIERLDGEKIEVHPDNAVAPVSYKTIWVAKTQGTNNWGWQGHKTLDIRNLDTSLDLTRPLMLRDGTRVCLSRWDPSIDTKSFGRPSVSIMLEEPDPARGAWDMFGWDDRRKENQQRSFFVDTGEHVLGENNERIMNVIDWTQPIELDDGTPLRLRTDATATCATVQLGVGISHPAFPISGDKGDVRTSNGLVISNHKFHVRNRTMTTKKIDVTKPLEVVPSFGMNSPATFITETSDGHILVSAEGLKSKWSIFDTLGRFVRSETGSGDALTLRNKPEKTCEYRAVYRDGAIGDPVYRNRALGWDSNPAADHLIQIDKTDGVVTGVGVLKRPS